MLRRCSAPSSERSKSDTVAIETFLGPSRESSVEIRNGEVAEVEEDVRTAEPQPDSKKAPEAMRLVERTRGRREEIAAERLNDGARMKVEQNNISCFSRMVVEEKLQWVEGELKKIEKNHCSLKVGLELTQKELERMKDG